LSSFYGLLWISDTKIKVGIRLKALKKTAWTCSSSAWQLSRLATMVAIKEQRYPPLGMIEFKVKDRKRDGKRNLGAVVEWMT